MEAELILELAAILILILANGFFALSEFSVIASRQSRLQQKIKDGKRGAEAAKKLNDSPDRFLASMQVGITLLAIFAGVFGGASFVNRLQSIIATIPLEFIQTAAYPLALAVVAILITIASVVFGELIPKYLALSNPEFYARLVAPTVTIFIRLTSFFSSSLSAISNGFLKIFGVDTSKSDSVISEEEIAHLIVEGKEKGVFDETEEKLIKSVFDFSDSTVRRAMTPRTEIIALTLDAPQQELIDLIVESGFSRYPVFEESVDKIIGVLYAKDLLPTSLTEDTFNLKELLREPLFVPDSMPLSKLLSVFQRQKVHIAVVLDEFGGTDGIITLEDIIEELVGEIQDEYDTEEEPLVKHSETIAFSDGSVWPGDINELMDTNLPEDEAETIAGLFINELGAIPDKTAQIVIANMKITILELEKNRLVRLKLEKISPKETNQE